MQSQRRDSRSRSRHRSRGHRRHESKEYRDRRRPLSRTQDLSRARSPDLPDSWQSTRTHYDTKTEYGLTFPRHVESTNFSRKNNTAGIPISDVKLVDIVSNGLENWALRLVANGRYVACEMFRNRLEATFSTMLFRELYRQKDNVDFAKLIQHLSSEPGDSQDWKYKLSGIEALIQQTVDLFKTLAPKDSNQSLLEELERMKKENAALRANQSQVPTQEGSQTQNTEEPPGGTLPSMFRQSATEELRRQKSQSMPSMPGAQDDRSPLSQYRRGQNAPILGTHTHTQTYHD